MRNSAAPRLSCFEVFVTAGSRPRLTQMSPVPGLKTVTGVTGECAMRANTYCCFAGGDGLVLEPEVDVEFELSELWVDD